LEISTLFRTPAGIACMLATNPSSLRFITPWLISLLPSRNSLKDQAPWIVFSAREWLESHLKSGMSVFEYGSGGSTIYLAKKVRRIVSIDHDKCWYDLIRSYLAKNDITNCEYILSEPEKSDKATTASSNLKNYASEDENCVGMDYEKYVRNIDKFPDAGFDLVLVDGRARVSCIKHAIPKIRPGGYLMLDDSERARYKEAISSFLSRYERKDFFGLTPYTVRLRQTSIWRINPSHPR
jgi:predicted O-methyltransferase YrrM